MADPHDPPSPIARFVGAIRVGVQAIEEVREAAARGVCVNCKSRRTRGDVKLCDVCGRNAAEAGAAVVGNLVEEGRHVLEDHAYDRLKAFFGGQNG